MSTSMNVFLNVLVLLPRLQIPIHFVVPIPAPYESFLSFPICIWVISSIKNTHFFRLWCGFPKVHNCSSPSLLVSCFAPPFEVWPRNHRETRGIPVGKHPVEDGRRKKHSFETENVNSHETPRWLQGADLVWPWWFGGEPVEVHYLDVPLEVGINA